MFILKLTTKQNDGKKKKNCVIFTMKVVVVVFLFGFVVCLADAYIERNF